ncbi:MAG: DUF362 domain-containing protein [Deltaproteobacteria bacterium]|nr:DUF362 domain-containing protein [Deltaproteobacteria bacterium]
MSKINTALHKWTRRDFLKTSARAGIFFTMGYPLISVPGDVWGSAESSPADLAVVSGNTEKAVLKAIDLLGGIKRFVKKGQRVVIKPNMSFAKTPDEAANTSPQAVATVARVCIEAGARDVLIVDHTLHKAKLCLERSGIRKHCKSIAGTHVLALDDERFYHSVSVPQGKVIKSLKIMKEVANCDVLINLPTAKSHSATGVSLGMKGLMGVIWDRGYFHAKADLHQAIADLSSTVKPALTIIDASRALITGGPSGPGKIEKLNTIIAGVDPVAVDSYGVTIANWYNKKFEVVNVKHIMAAHRMGLGNINLNQLRIKKETV